MSTNYTREQLIAASPIHHVTCVQLAIDEADRRAAADDAWVKEHCNLGPVTHMCGHPDCTHRHIPKPAKRVKFTEAELIQGIRLGIADFSSRTGFPGTTMDAVIRRVIPQIREARP